MNKLLKAVLKTIYTVDDETINTMVENSKKDGSLLEWYQIATIKLEREMQREVR